MKSIIEMREIYKKMEFFLKENLLSLIKLNILPQILLRRDKFLKFLLAGTEIRSSNQEYEY